MSFYIFVDTRSASFQSFKQNIQISAFHEYVLTLIATYQTLQKEYACIPQLKALLVNASPSTVQLIRNVSSFASLSTTLRSRYSCTGAPSSVVINTWKMMQHSLDLVADSISPYERNNKVKTFTTGTALHHIITLHYKK
jgi:hypothetical protein